MVVCEDETLSFATSEFCVAWEPEQAHPYAQKYEVHLFLEGGEMMQATIPIILQTLTFAATLWAIFVLG